MFTGLTNQVSTWIGKKAEERGPETSAAKNTTSPIRENIVERRRDSPTRGNQSSSNQSSSNQSSSNQGNSNQGNSNQGSSNQSSSNQTSSNQTSSKLDMLSGVKSHMSGWLSGGIAGLGHSSAHAHESASPAPVNQAQVPQGPTEEVKDDDASSATGGADSGPASLEGTPTDDKNGHQPFSAVSTKALEGAKNLGGLLFNVVNKAGKTVVEAGVKIKKSVEENRLVAELNKEQEAFIANKRTEKGEAVAPWVGAPNEDVLREECLSLSMDKSNFLRSPPEGVDFEWNFEAVQSMAQATLALDANLKNMRFQLVPKEISEEMFWRNYFYRVSVLRQSHELNAMAQAENKENPTEAVIQPEVQVTTGQETGGTVTTGSNSASADSPGHEFVSDSMRVTDTDLQEVREGMKKLGMQPPKA